MTRTVSARLVLLDKQILDRDGLPIGRVDDVRLDLPRTGGPPRVDALLVGAQALGERIDGLPGRAMAAVARRLRDPGAPGPATIAPRLVRQLEPTLQLGARLAELPEVAGLERWLGQQVVQRIPGGGRAVE